MVTINFKRVSRIVKKPVMLDDLDLTIEPAMISAIDATVMTMSTMPNLTLRGVCL